MQLELIISVYKEELTGQLWALHIVDCLLHICLLYTSDAADEVY